MIYLFLVLLLVNQCLSVHSFRLILNGDDQVRERKRSAGCFHLRIIQNELEDVQREDYQQLEFKRLAAPGNEDEIHPNITSSLTEDSSYDVNETPVIVQPTVQRRTSPVNVNAPR